MRVAELVAELAPAPAVACRRCRRPTTRTPTAEEAAKRARAAQGNARRGGPDAASPTSTPSPPAIPTRWPRTGTPRASTTSCRWASFRGPGAVRSLFSELFAAMPDMRVHRHPDDRGRRGRRRPVADPRARSPAAPFQGIEPTGRRIELRGIDCLEIDDDGLITATRPYYDGAAFARGIGMLPAEDSGADRAMRGAFNAVTRVRPGQRKEPRRDRPRHLHRRHWSSGSWPGRSASRRSTLSSSRR